MEYMILIQDDWSQYALVENHLAKPKLFQSREEAWNYATEMELFRFQLIEVLI